MHQPRSLQLTSHAEVLAKCFTSHRKMIHCAPSSCGSGGVRTDSCCNLTWNFGQWRHTAVESEPLPERRSPCQNAPRRVIGQTLLGWVGYRWESVHRVKHCDAPEMGGRG